MAFLIDSHYTTALPTNNSTDMSYFVPEELRCQYSSKRCENPRTNKKSGGLHKFCAVHREKANRNQMRLDHRRRVMKKMQQREQQEQQQKPGMAASTSTSTIGNKRQLRSEPYPVVHTHRPEIYHNIAARHTIMMPPVENLFNSDDLHILEALLFSDDDQAQNDSTVVKVEDTSSSDCYAPSSPAAVWDSPSVVNVKIDTMPRFYEASNAMAVHPATVWDFPSINV